MLAQSFNVGHVGEFFRKYRARHRIHQKKLAETLDVQFPYIANTETGKIKSPKALIKRLYKILNSDERLDLVNAIRQDTFDELNAFIEELEGD